MRICIPTETDKGKDAPLCSHFGSAPYFTICDTVSNTVETINNTNQDHVHGQCQPLSALTDKNIDALICKGMGLRVANAMIKAGIKTYITDAAIVDEALQECVQGNLKQFTPGDCCTEHSCH